MFFDEQTGIAASDNRPSAAILAELKRTLGGMDAFMREKAKVYTETGNRMGLGRK